MTSNLGGEQILSAASKGNLGFSAENKKDTAKEIKDKINGFKCSLQNEGIPEEIKNFPMGQMYLSMFSSVTENPKLMEKLFNPEFQSKILSMQTNPTEMFKDKEIMGMLIEMIKTVEFKKQLRQIFEVYEKEQSKKGE